MGIPFKTYKHKRNRKHLPGTFYPLGAALLAAPSIAALKARLTFNAPVSVSALPVEITRQAAGAGPQLLPIAYTVVSPTIVDLTYAASVVNTDVLTIPANVPSIRGIAGGVVAAQVHTFP